MKPDVIVKSIPLLFLILILNCQTAWADANIEKTLTLHPGWNSVFLTIQPEVRTPGQVFNALPAGSSVWTWINKNSRVEFISNPNEELLKIPGWCVYFNDQDKLFLNNLYAIIAGWAYLINVSGDQDITLNITGVASVKKTPWIADSFNLAGFNVDSEDPPDFTTYFAASAAHEGQAIFALDNSTGNWVYIDNPSNTKIKQGEAYWVYCEGASNYQGPLEVTLPNLNGLDYGKFNDTLMLTFHNAFDQSLLVNIVTLSSEIDLVYRIWNTDTGSFEWPPLNSMPPFPMAKDSWENIRIAVQRESLDLEKAQSLLRIRSNLGTQLFVPVFVEKEISQ